MILEESRQGPLTARIDNRYLHSRYSPQKEADHFYKRWQKENGLSEKLIIIEPGLGYLIRTVENHYKPEDVYIVFLSAETRNHCQRAGLLKGIGHSLMDDRDDELYGLRRFLDACDIRDTAVLEWPAGMQIFERRAVHLRSIIMKVFRIKQGNELTEKRFSTLWFRNGIANYIRNDYSYVPGRNESPVILCASGPSLEIHLPDIKRLSDSCIIAALPSSLRVLLEHNIQTDIVFSTDPGYYAREHLRYLNDGALVVSPLSGASAGRTGRLMGFRQNSSFEGYLFKDGELPVFQEMGTVAATGIDFLIRWKGGQPLYICGLDLCFDDIKMHAGPHSFDPLVLGRESRLHPGYSLYYERAASMTDSIEGPYRFTKSMKTYQNWFSMQSFPENVFRLAPETVDLNLPVRTGFPSFEGRKSFLVNRNDSYPSLDERRKRLTLLLSSLRKDLKEYEGGAEGSPFLKSFCKALSMKSVDYDKMMFYIEKWSRL